MIIDINNIDINDLPPYGYTLADNLQYLAGNPVPKGFLRTLGNAGSGGPGDWKAWMQKLASEMSDFLWPKWEPGVGWTGAAATKAGALTKADLTLLQDIQATEALRPIRGNGVNRIPQMVAFREEDDRPPDRTFDYYEHVMPVSWRRDFAANILIGGHELGRPVSQGLKSLLQRPRASQVGFMLNLVPPLVVQRSVSALTPAMISGHCVQGTLALAQVLFAMGPQLRTLPGLEADVIRFLLDTGDRRVYAGLHYPADNISSWYTALSLCDHVFGASGPVIRAQLWAAIQTSAVYGAIVNRGDVAAYGPLLAKLESRATHGANQTGAW